MRNTENNSNEIYFKKFQIAKIKNPQLIKGGNLVLKDDDDDKTSQRGGQN